MKVVLKWQYCGSVFLKIFFDTLLLIVPLIAASESWGEPPWDAMTATKFSEMQAVKADGSSVWSIPTWGAEAEQGYILTGVVLNNPADMLDSTPNYIPSAEGTLWQLGAQWQIYVQTVDPSDFGGAAVYIAQNYGNHVWHWDSSDFATSTSYSYTNEEWEDEIERISLLGTLQAGDLIEIHARGGLFYKGKYNVNEQHDNDPIYDFEIIRLGHLGLPDPTLISLADVKNPDDTFKFVQDRSSGAEHYQATLVELKNVSIVDASGWGANGTVTISDGALTLAMQLGLTGFDSMSAPTGSFDVWGIFDQEGSNYTSGYRLWVTDAGQITLVPEPSILALLAGAVFGMFVLKLRRG
jgi:hypothetical protein